MERQIAGPTRVRRLFRRRTDALIAATVATVVLLALIGLVNQFWIALVLVVAWALIFAIEGRYGRPSSTASSRPSNARPSSRSTT